MQKNNLLTVPFKRKREGRTYYKKRLKMLLSNKNRFVVRKSLKNLQVSVIKYNAKGDDIVLTVNSSSLPKLGWKGDNGNISSAYLTGLLAGKKAIGKGVTEAIPDFGFSKPTKGSRLYATLAGAADAGLKIPFDQKILPSKERISGDHIAKYAAVLKNEQSKYDRHFSNYIKRGLDPEDIVKHFNDMKAKING